MLKIRKFVSNFENAKKYSDFVGFIIRMTFCLTVSAFFNKGVISTNFPSLYFFDKIASIVFLILGLIFVPMIEDILDSFMENLFESKSGFSSIINRSFSLIITIIVFVSIIAAAFVLAASTGK